MIPGLVEQMAQARTALDRARRVRSLACVPLGIWMGLIAAGFIVCTILLIIDRASGLNGAPGSASNPGLVIPVCITGGLLPVLGLGLALVVRHYRRVIGGAEREVAESSAMVAAAVASVPMVRNMMGEDTDENAMRSEGDSKRRPAVAR